MKNVPETIPIGITMYSENGREIFPCLGLTVYPGTMIRVGNGFEKLNKKYVLCAGNRDFVSDMNSNTKMTSYRLKEILD